MGKVKSFAFGVVGGMLAVCVAGAVLYFAGMVPKSSVSTAGEVRATAFVLVDATGQQRAQIFASPGGATMSLSDEMGKPRVMLAVDGNKATILLTGGTAKATAGITVTRDGSSMVALSDENGVVRANLGIVAQGGEKAAWVGISDTNGNPIWSSDR